jgi:carbonic anhydrase
LLRFHFHSPSEDVHWVELAEPIQCDSDQIAAFRGVFTGNNRPVQPLHDRAVLMGE